MANMRTTVILKTDIVDSTPRTAGLTQSEMGLQRRQHKQFISDIAVKNHGLIFQEEGDAYWIEFPSVTTAVLAGMEMHQGLRSLQAGRVEKQRLAIRAVIQQRDAVGEAAGERVHRARVDVRARDERLQDVRAQIGHQARAIWAGQHAREVEDVLKWFDEQQVVPAVMRDPTTGAAHFDCAQDGTLAFVPGAASGEVAAASRQGLARVRPLLRTAPPRPAGPSRSACSG